MLIASPNPRQPARHPICDRHATPPISQAMPQIHTVWEQIAPDGIGRVWRCCRSNPTSNASFKNIPPTYSDVAPTNNQGRSPALSAPARNQPAKQLDHTVGRFETRPRINRARTLASKDFCAVPRFITCGTILCGQAVLRSNHIRPLIAQPRFGCAVAPVTLPRCKSPFPSGNINLGWLARHQILPEGDRWYFQIKRSVGYAAEYE